MQEEEDVTEKGAFLSTSASYDENQLSLINEACGLRAVYNSDSRVYLASDEIRGKFEIRECNGNYQLKVKISDLIEKFSVC